jgi:hypothetical protein
MAADYKFDECGCECKEDLQTVGEGAAIQATPAGCGAVDQLATKHGEAGEDLIQERGDILILEQYG